jgi:ABC-type uncharacterized transport system ATPase subunit
LLRDLPGVIAVTDSGNFQELRLRADADPQMILHSLIKAGPIEHFELAQPSLRDIFIRIASPVLPSESSAKEPLPKELAV